MRSAIRGPLPVLALLVGLSVIVDAASTPATARAEVQLELADLLMQDRRYWESISVLARAKEGGTPEQLERVSAGLIRALLTVAEFNQAYKEARTLEAMNPQDPERRALYADGLWAYGLFEEAEAVYREVLSRSPSSPGGHYGMARSLSGQSRHADALSEIQAAIAAAPETPEYYHTLASIYRQLRRYDDAAQALDRFVELIPGGTIRDAAQRAQADARFLRSFGDRVPFEMPDRDVVHTLPFRLINDKVTVRASINGSDPMELVVDSGAEQMVLSEETAQETDVRPITSTLSAGVGDVGLRGLELGRVDSLRIGTFEVRNLPAIIKNPPLTGLPSTQVQNSISPIAFGLSTMIDYRNSHLILARSLPPSPADSELPMRVNRLAVVRGLINGRHPNSFIVDTGGEVISISLSTAITLETRPPRRIPLRVFGTSGWDREAFLLPGVNLAFADIEYNNHSVVVLNLHLPSALLGFHIGGIIGHTFLSEYVVSLDMEQSLLRLRKY